MSDNKPKYPVQTVSKAIEIINYLAKDTSNRGAGITELSREIGMGKSTIHRILDTLLYYGYIDKNWETNRYRLGWELYSVGQRVPRQNQIFNLDPAYLTALSQKTGETVRAQDGISYAKSHISILGYPHKRGYPLLLVIAFLLP